MNLRYILTPLVQNVAYLSEKRVQLVENHTHALFAVARCGALRVQAPIRAYIF
jgi:hypothetical protein